MSSIFIIDLKDVFFEFASMNKFANQMISFALQKNIGVFFNSYDYAKELIEDAKMNNFITLSDSFLYKNCNFLDTTSFDVLDRNSFCDQFFAKFDFINDILDLIKQIKTDKIDIYISCDGSVEKVNDFTICKCTKNEVLDELINNIYNCSNEFAYGFPTIKLEVSFDEAVETKEKNIKNDTI